MMLRRASRTWRRARGGTNLHRGDLLHTRAEVVVAEGSSTRSSPRSSRGSWVGRRRSATSSDHLGSRAHFHGEQLPCPHVLWSSEASPCRRIRRRSCCRRPSRRRRTPNHQRDGAVLPTTSEQRLAATCVETFHRGARLAAVGISSHQSARASWLTWLVRPDPCHPREPRAYMHHDSCLVVVLMSRRLSR